MSGTPFGIASVLLPKVELQNYTHLVNATMYARINLKLDLKLDLKCKNIFECSSFDVISDVNFLTSFLNQKTIATGFLNVSKKVNENIVSELKLSDFANQYFVVSSITSEINIDVLKHIFEMKAKVLDNDKEVIDIKSFVFNAKKNIIMVSI